LKSIGSPYTDACPIATHLSRDATSDESITLIRSWLNDCTLDHRCPLNYDVELPTRLVDLGMPDREMLRLYAPEPGITGKYVALSYCWGKSQAFTATPKSISTQFRGFPLMSLPKTIQDAIRVTRGMGIRYLWVDSLCILQGSDAVSQTDWKRESSRMESIYGNAYFTIAAAAASNCGEGFLHPRSCNLPFRIRSDSGVPIREGLITVAPSKISREWKDEPINTRGWTLQERILSTRVISFSLHETTFLCDSSVVRDKTGVHQYWHKVYQGRAPPTHQNDLRNSSQSRIYE